MKRFLFLQIVSDKWEQNNRALDTYYVHKDYSNVIKVYDDYIEFDSKSEPAKTQKVQKDRN